MNESREFKLGVYRIPPWWHDTYSRGGRHIVTIRLRWDEETGDRFVSLTGEVLRKHSSHGYAYGQTLDEYLPADVRTFWDRWHLSDMRAGCEHQRELGWTSYDEHPSEPCPVCGYKYGTAWLKEPLDDDAIAWLARHGLRFPE